MTRNEKQEASRAMERDRLARTIGFDPLEAAAALTEASHATSSRIAGVADLDREIERLQLEDAEQHYVKTGIERLERLDHNLDDLRSDDEEEERFDD